MKAILLLVQLLAVTALPITINQTQGLTNSSNTLFINDTESRQGEKIRMTLSCPDCSQLMTGTFQYGYNATITVACPKCHKHWLVHYDWIHDSESALSGHWQKKLRIIQIKKS